VNSVWHSVEKELLAIETGGDDDDDDDDDGGVSVAGSIFLSVAK